MGLANRRIRAGDGPDYADLIWLLTAYEVTAQDPLAFISAPWAGKVTGFKVNVGTGNAGGTVDVEIEGVSCLDDPVTVAADASDDGDTVEGVVDSDAQTFAAGDKIAVVTTGFASAGLNTTFQVQVRPLLGAEIGR